MALRWLLLRQQQDRRLMSNAGLSHEVDFDSFNTILSAEHVSRPKPDPAIYHLAMEKCGATNTDDVLVIEDTLANCAAAQAAGLRSVFYPGEFAAHIMMKAQSLSIERCLQAYSPKTIIICCVSLDSDSEQAFFHL